MAEKPADDKRATPKAGEAPPRKRPAPTIDLTATEVGAEPAQPKPEPSAPQSDPPRAAEPKSEPELEAKPQAEPRGNWRATLTAGVAGGGIVAVLLIAAWAVTPARQATPLAAGNTQATDDIKDRLGKLEQSISKIPPPDTGNSERLAGVENAMKAIGIALTALNQRSDEIAAALAASSKASANNEALQQRIDALESAAKVTQDKVAQNAGADSVARAALAAVALRDAVGRGEPYAAQLGAVRALNPDGKLTPLETFAATGLPNDAALSRELAALLPSMLDASGASAEAQGNFIERLQGNAGKLVRIRPANEPAGDDASAIMARLELKAARSDVAGAQADIAKLGEKPRAIADAWLKKVESRNAARAAADALVADATRGLGKP